MATHFRILAWKIPWTQEPDIGETAIKVTALVDDRVFGLINHELRGDMN